MFMIYIAFLPLSVKSIMFKNLVFRSNYMTTISEACRPLAYTSLTGVSFRSR